MLHPRHHIILCFVVTNIENLPQLCQSGMYKLKK